MTFRFILYNNIIATEAMKTREKKFFTKVVAFDADDTLWDCQTHFEKVQEEYCRLLSPWADREQVLASLLATEKGNMQLLGFGCKAFTMSLIENAIGVTGGRIGSGEIAEILRMGKWLLSAPGTPLPEVVDTLERLKSRGGMKMMVFTKGEAIDQKSKMRRSGLSGYFDDMVITDEKSPDEYLRLCRMCRCRPEEMTMVGNSFKSDIAPALAVGMKAIHIPFHTTWALEQTEEYEHPNLVKINHFSEILDCCCGEE